MTEPVTRTTDARNWVRLGIEACTIVLSVLLALSLASWAEDLSERSETARLLERWVSELESNRELLNRTIRKLDENEERFATLLSLPNPDVQTLGQGAVESYLLAFIGADRFNPVGGTLESAIREGQLGQIRSADLRSAISRWSGLIANAETEKEEMTRAAARVVELLEPYGGPFAVPLPESQDRLDVLPEATWVTLIQMRNDDLILAAARTKLYWAGLYRNKLNAILDHLDFVLVILRDEL